MSNNPPVELMLIDFEAEYQAVPDQALLRLQCLLLDEDACRARIAFLESVASDDAERENELGSAEETADLVGRFGVFDTVEEGYADVAALHRLTCDPAALWRAHVSLCRFDDAVDQVGLTSLALQTNWDTFRDRLSVYVPAIIQHVGFPASHAGEVLDLLVERAAEIGYHHFRDRLAGWLTEYAEDRGFPVVQGFDRNDWEAIIDAHVRTVVCEHVKHSEGRPEPWRSAFVESAERAESWRQLGYLELPPPFEPISSFLGFQKDIVELSESVHDEVTAFLEYEV